MKVLVMYDSIFGNTEQIARAIGSSIGSQEDVEVLRVSEVHPEQLAGLELMIVGSPTRGFKPTPEITDFLKNLANDSLQGVKAAAFDTRLAPADIDAPIVRILVKLGGYAAKLIADRLKKKGASLVVYPKGFFVKSSGGPLKEGEIERAAAWAKEIVEARKPA
jgi:flavodoxin I